MPSWDARSKPTAHWGTASSNPHTVTPLKLSSRRPAFPMSARTMCGHELRGLANGYANASLLLRAFKPRQLNSNGSDYICASRRRSVSEAPLTIFGVANFGRPQLQYDTFELSKLPSASVLSGSGTPAQKRNRGNTRRLKCAKHKP